MGITNWDKLTRCGSQTHKITLNWRAWQFGTCTLITKKYRLTTKSEQEDVPPTLFTDVVQIKVWRGIRHAKLRLLNYKNGDGLNTITIVRVSETPLRMNYWLTLCETKWQLHKQRCRHGRDVVFHCSNAMWTATLITLKQKLVKYRKEMDIK